MKPNIGGIDGFFRLLISIVLIGYAIVAGPWWLALFSLPLIATNYLMWCPLYEIAGVNFAGAPVEGKSNSSH